MWLHTGVCVDGSATGGMLVPCLQLVGPLLVHGEPEPLPAALERIMAQAGPQGVVYAR
jgi:hypothetical protein